MRLRILLINPWIYDFAAYNLWAKPVGLLKVAEYLSAFDAELFLIDCTDSFDARRFGTGRFRAQEVEKPLVLRRIPRIYKRYGISTDEFTEKVKQCMPFDLVLVTTMMGYWYPGVWKAVGMIKDISGDTPVILGGIYATLYHSHALETSGADFIYRGRVSSSLNFALNTFGFRLKRKRDAVPYYELGLYDTPSFGTLLTSTGCPFCCTYCASGLLGGQFSRRAPEHVIEEIKELHRRGVRDFAFYDDALLVDADEHIKPILRTVIDEMPGTRFHTPNGLHARLVDEELAQLMKQSGFETVRLSLETVDATRQGKTGNKVSNEDIRIAVRHLRRHGFKKDEIGVYLMYGLPGQDIEEVKQGVEFLKLLGVRIHLTEFSPIRGTRAWDELVNDGIIDDTMDPLLTNNTVFSYLFSTYDEKELRELKRTVKEYNAA